MVCIILGRIIKNYVIVAFTFYIVVHPTIAERAGYFKLRVTML
jgi:hypothetical protein